MPRDKTGHFYYSWYPTVYQADTQHLTLQEDGAYRRLLDHYMMTRAPLQNDDRALARIVGVGLDEWLSVRERIITYFKPAGLFLRHGFCDQALAMHDARISKSQNNGKKGGRPTSGKTEQITQQVMETEPDRNPITEQNKTEDSIGGGVSARARDPAFRKVYQSITEAFPNLAVKEPGIIHSWLATADPDLDILPAIAMVKAQNLRPETFGYFGKVIAKCRDQRLTPPTNPPTQQGSQHGNYPLPRKSKSDQALDAINEALAEMGVSPITR